MNVNKAVVIADKCRYLTTSQMQHRADLIFSLVLSTLKPNSSDMEWLEQSPKSPIQKCPKLSPESKPNTRADFAHSNS